MTGWRKFILSVSLATLAAALPSYAQSNQSRWEPARNISVNMKQVMKHPRIEVFTAPSQISITVNQPVNVKIFTILGKLVSSQNLEPGTYDYHLNPHGVYIIKAAEITCKVAI